MLPLSPWAPETVHHGGAPPQHPHPAQKPPHHRHHVSPHSSSYLQLVYVCQHFFKVLTIVGTIFALHPLFFSAEPDPLTLSGYICTHPFQGMAVVELRPPPLSPHTASRSLRSPA